MKRQCGNRERKTEKKTIVLGWKHSGKQRRGGKYGKLSADALCNLRKIKCVTEKKKKELNCNVSENKQEKSKGRRSVSEIAADYRSLKTNKSKQIPRPKPMHCEGREQ